MQNTPDTIGFNAESGVVDVFYNDTAWTATELASHIATTAKSHEAKQGKDVMKEVSFLHL